MRGTICDSHFAHRGVLRNPCVSRQGCSVRVTVTFVYAIHLRTCFQATSAPAPQSFYTDTRWMAPSLLPQMQPEYIAFATVFTLLHLGVHRIASLKVPAGRWESDGVPGP